MRFQIVIELSLHLVKLFEQNCPETLKACFVVNANAIFSILFSIVKPFLTSRTLDKLHVYGKDKEVWKQALIEHLPADQLSESYGGTLPDRDLVKYHMHFYGISYAVNCANADFELHILAPNSTTEYKWSAWTWICRNKSRSWEKSLCAVHGPPSWVQADVSWLNNIIVMRAGRGKAE